nr:hypothetical protein [Tanacetum cinerariifolium]
MPKKQSPLTYLPFNSYFLDPLYRLILMSTFVLCVGCGVPLYGFSPCQWCTCESCGNDLRDGFCSLCNSRNSCVYDPNPNSFDCPPDFCHPPRPTHETYSCDSYGNNSHFGYDCQPQFLINYESELGYIENYNSYLYDSSSFPQQELCCKNCGVTHEAYQCQPMNEDYYHEQYSCYDSNSFGFDQSQPQQYTVNHPIFNTHNELLSSRTKLMEQMTQLTSMCEMVGQFIQKKQEEKRIEEEQAAKAQNSKIPVCYDDDDDWERSNSLKDNIIYGLSSCFVITPNEPVDSLSMGDEHLNTIPATESDKFIKSSIENLVPNPSESKSENGCDVPACFITFSNVLFDAEYKFDSSDDQSCSDEDVPEKIFSNPLFDEEIISIKIDPHHFNVESDLIESLLNHDSSIVPSSSKIDSLLDEFADKLTLLKSIPSGIDETDCDPKEDIRLIERLLYDNSSPRSPKEFVSKNSNADIESISPSPIPIEGSDSFMEEIDLTFNLDDPMPSGIKEDDYDSERDILIREELLDNYSLSLPVNESFHFYIHSFSRPPAKPLDGNTEILNIKMMGDNSEQKVKENQEKDKIGSKPDKNGKRVEARKSLKQLQWVEEEKLNKTQKNGRKRKRSQKLFKYLEKEEKKRVKSANSRKNKMHKAFLLPGESSHWQYKFPLLVEGVPTARRMEIPLPGVCTAMMKKLPVKDRWQLH